MLYTYSPNWYRPQCLCFYDSTLFYSSNYLLYEFDLENKKVIREKCFRKIAMQHTLNHRDIKINALACDRKNLFVAINQAYLFIINKETFEVKEKLVLNDFIAAESIYLFKNSLIISDKEGIIAKCNKNEPIKKIFEPENKIGRLKALYCFEKYQILFHSKGLISIFEENWEHCINSIDIEETILSIDVIDFLCCMLTLNKEKIHITVFEFDFKSFELIKKTKTLENISINLKKFDVSIEYPKNYFEKLKESLKASLTLKIISSSEIILTGKLGEIISIYLEEIETKSLLILKPFSFEQTSKKYNIWADSHHFKDIYAIYEHEKYLVFIGTDHRLTFWISIENEFKLLFSIKFLTSAVSNFFFPEHDPKTIFMLLKDSVIRECNPLEEGGHILNEYWKFIKKFIIKKVLCHPTEEGVMAMQTSCNRILIFDIYEDRLMKVVEMNEEVLTLSFEAKTIIPILERINVNIIEPVKLLFASSFIKEMIDEFYLFIQCKNNFYFTTGIAAKEITFNKISKKYKNERIHDNKYWDNEILLSTQCKQNKLRLFVSLKNEILEQEHILKYQNSRYMFKYPKNSHKLYIINYKSKELNLSEYEITEKITHIRSKECSLLKFIDMIHISYSDDRIICFNKKDEQIQLLNINECLNGIASIKLFELGAQIECLSLYLNEWLIFASKDQSMKIVHISRLKEL